MGNVNRRDFAQTAGAALLASSQVLGANDRIRIGLIGAGGRGREVFKAFLAEPDVQPVAVCDVYEPHLLEGASMAGGKVEQFKDWRKLLERNDIDAVLVQVPDHWHALMTIAACEAGKDVYVEKPLSLTVKEGRAMVNAARTHNRVVQTGSQQRSGKQYHKAVQLVRDGALGPVPKISAGFIRNASGGFTSKPTDASKLDWDMWLGPAPHIAYDPFRCIYNFRWFWDYSGGQMTNWGAHELDIARWALGEAAPVSVAAYGGRYVIKDGGETPDVQEVVYQFPNAVVTWSGREMNASRGGPLEFHGTKGSLRLTRKGFDVAPELLDNKPMMEALKEPASPLNELHARNFLDCLKSRKKPNADVEEGHRTAILCHLGNIATRLGRSLKWDAAKEQIIGDAEANKWLAKEYRRPWKSPQA